MDKPSHTHTHAHSHNPAENPSLQSNMAYLLTYLVPTNQSVKTTGKTKPINLTARTSETEQKVKVLHASFNPNNSR